MGEEGKNKETELNKSNPNNESNKTDEKKEEQKVDVEKVKNDAMSEFLKNLGVDDMDSLQGIVKKAKEDEEKNKTELERKNDTLTATTKELATEKEARIIAEAKLSAIKMGAKPELVDNLVVVAKSRVTKEKDIDAVIAEMKDSETEKIYFQSDEEDEEEKKGGTVTRKRVTKMTDNKKDETKKDKKGKDDKGDKEDEKHEGTRAEKIFGSRKQKRKGHYFS